MRMLVSCLFILFLMISYESLGAPSSDKVKRLVNAYYLSHDVLKPRPLPDPPESENPAPGHPPHRPPPECSPNRFPSNCIEAVCQQLSRFECDDRDDILEVTRACRNVNGDCIRNICGRVSRFACDEKVEVFEVAEACRGLYDVSCIDYVCSRLSRFDCDEVSELAEIARQCK